MVHMTASVKLTAMVPQQDVDRLAEIAVGNDRSIAAEVRIALRTHIQKETANGNA